MWPGLGLETARVPPTLDSPQSAAPETFLSRDAVSAFPLKYVPLPQPLPGVRCCESVAHAQLPWRFFWSPAPRLSDRAGWRVPLQRFHLRYPLRSPRSPNPSSYREAPRSERKSRARRYPVANWKRPGPPRFLGPAATSSLGPPRRSLRNPLAPASLVPRNLSVARERFP